MKEEKNTLKTKWYEVEIGSTTYRTYEIKAESKEKAEELALDSVDSDCEISKAWKENAEVTSCDRFKLDKDGLKIIG
jgi:hypothetical protein